MILNLQKTFNRYVENKCSENEIRALIKYFGEDLNEEQLKALIEAQLDKEVNEFSKINVGHYDVFQKTNKFLKANIYYKPLIIILLKNYLFKYVAAVAIMASVEFLSLYFSLRPDIEVLGTKFNTSCYNDDSFQKTTLLSGCINIITNHSYEKHRFLPVEQSFYEINKTTKTSTVNTETAIAWRQGNFMFDVCIKDILKQLSGGYNVKIDYRHFPETGYNVLLAKKETLNNLPKTLEYTGRHSFQNNRQYHSSFKQKFAYVTL